MALKSGSVVQARCGTCQADTRHVVVKAARGVPSRVRCRGCGREHAYRPKSAAATAVPRNRPPAPKSKPVKKPVGKPTAVAATRSKSAPSPAAKAAKPVPARAAQAVAKGNPTRPAPPPAREPELPPYEKALKEAENRAPEAYRISGVYRERQRLQHPVFGLGVVTKVLQSNVFDAIFADGPRKLAMAREEPKGSRGTKAHRPAVAAAKTAAAPTPRAPARPATAKPVPAKAAPAKAAPGKAAPAKAAPVKSAPSRKLAAPARAAARPKATTKPPAKARRR